MNIHYWLNQFLGSRGLSKPNGQVLFKYQVKRTEYATLKEYLKNSKNSVVSSPDFRYWAAALSLYISEWYRREYSGSWHWKAVEQTIGLDLSVQQREDVLTRGLDQYWNRPIRSRGGLNRDLLGSLFLEGGLPWTFIQRGHNLGTIIEKGLREYYRTIDGFRSTHDLVEESLYILPKSFRNEETMIQISGIIDRLMMLGKDHSLSDKKDPIKYLNVCDPTWREHFPIPIDDNNAQNLVSEWLKDAGERNKELKDKQKQSEDPFSCKHYHHGDLAQLRLRTRIQLPGCFILPGKDISLPTTRLDLLVYEGSKLIQHEGVVHAALPSDNSDNTVEIRFTQKNKNIRIRREKPDEPLILAMSGNGQTVDRIILKDSAVDPQRPLLFMEGDDQHELYSDCSVDFKEPNAIIRIPADSRFESYGCELLHTEETYSKWYRINSKSTVITNGSEFVFKPNSTAINRKYQLSGRECLETTAPVESYYGIPGIVARGSVSTGDVLENVFFEGRPVDSQNPGILTGAGHLELRNDKGQTVFKRLIGILPQGLSVRLEPTHPNMPATAAIRGSEGITISLDDRKIRATEVDCLEGRSFELQPVSSRQVPTSVNIRLRGDQSLDPVTIQYPYPLVGAHLTDGDGNNLAHSQLSLDRLPGVRILLRSKVNELQRFYLSLTLVDRIATKLEILHRYEVAEETIEINVFGLRSEFVQLLSAVDNQDAYVNLTLSHDTLGIIHECSVHRFDGIVESDRDFISIRPLGNDVLADQAIIRALKISDPSHQVPIDTERTSEGVGTNVFELPHALSKDGPWLIIPDSASQIQFRPYLHLTSDMEINPQKPVSSLHQAVKQFHPTRNPNVINMQVAEMAKDFYHTGWQYLMRLLDLAKHLPLSTFEVWKSVAKNNAALASMVFRLPTDETLCNRISDELAVLWHTIPVNNWVTAYQTFSEWMSGKGIPCEFVAGQLKRQIDAMRSRLSVLEYLESYIREGRIKTLNSSIVPMTLSDWIQDLMRSHADEKWPTYLKRELDQWIESSDIPGYIKKLPFCGYTSSVIYLPIFMAEITTGRIEINSFCKPSPEWHFQINRLIDFDRHLWFDPVYCMMVYYMLQSDDAKETEAKS